MKKNIFITMLLLLSIISTNANVSAKEIQSKNNVDYILENANPDDIYLENGELKYSEEYLSQLEEKNEQLERSYKKYIQTQSMNIKDTDFSLMNIKPSDSVNGFCYTSRTLNVPTYQQETNFWCGPASVKETLQFLNGSSLSQSQYASNMETNSSDGTIVWKLRNELNNRQSKHSYIYEDISSVSRFNEILIADVLDSDVGVPFILHALTGSLYLYNGNTLYHYLVVNGGDQSKQQVTYVDSWGQDYGRGTTLGRHTDTRANVANTVTASNRFVIW